MATNRLGSLLTRDLYVSMVDARIPFDKRGPIDYGQAIQRTFYESGDAMEELRPTAYPVLKALGDLGLDDVPNLMDYLPQPEDPDFPLQALGLQLLLDQAPRALLTGVDARYTYAHFGEISVRYLKQLQHLPPSLHPAAWERWKGSVSVDYYVLTRLWWGAPIVHSEKLGDEALAFTNATREFVEHEFGVRDPYRDQPDKRWDLYGFPRMLEEGGPKSPCNVAQGWFWLACLMDVHYPPLKKYGRYPYQNQVFGRVPTPDEEEWMRVSGWFRREDPKVAERIRDDVAAGRWTPLPPVDEKYH